MDGFTSTQKAAVVTPGPLILTAGPGSGKTRVMVGRAAYFIDQAIDPAHIYCMTFTKDATAEFMHRLKEAHPEGSKVNVSNIHQLAYAIIKAVTGRRPNIIDSNKAMSWARDIDFDAPEDVLNRISRVRTSNQGTTEDKKLADQYLAFLKANHVTDMDGLIHIAHSMLDRWLENHTVKAVLVDEFQDTDLAQYHFIRDLIRAANADACVVGDDDQSIYGFRGAMPQLFEYMRKDLGARTIHLVDSFRCLPHIIDAANTVVAALPRKGIKNIRSVRKHVEGSRVEMQACGSALNQSFKLIESVKQLLERGIPANEIAVLARTRDSLTLPALALQSADIGFNVASWQNPFRTKTRRIVLGLIRFMAESIDLTTFTQHATKLGAMIDVKAVESLAQYKDKPFELFERSAANLFRGWARKSALHALEVARESFNGDWKKLEARCLKMTKPIQTNPDGVVLATAHAAKGLEWTAVIVIGADDLSFPHPNCIHTHEERRILFVAMTRAKDELIMLSSTSSMCGFLTGRPATHKTTGLLAMWRKMFG